jgi:hypothetical protein
MPEEAHGEMEDTQNNVKEKTEDDEYDHQADSDPNPWTDVGEVNHI